MADPEGARIHPLTCSYLLHRQLGAAYAGFLQGHSVEETRAILREWITKLPNAKSALPTGVNLPASSTTVCTPKPLTRTPLLKSFEVSDELLLTAASLSCTSDALSQQTEALSPSKDWIHV